MIIKMLNENWKMHTISRTDWQEAEVPGSVYTDLLRNGNMEDPFWRDNEEKSLVLMENDYEYCSEFFVEKDFFECTNIKLKFHGVDTIADVYFNEIHIGSLYNMHRIWEFDVKKAVKEGKNHIRVVLHSPLKYIREKFKECPTLGAEDAMDGFVHIRKAHCMFGWDWGPHLPDAGICRPISLVGFSWDRIHQVNIEQIHNCGKVSLKIKVKTEQEINVSYRISILDPFGVTKVYDQSVKKIEIESPQLWWPNGVGEQPLYGVKVELFNNKVVEDVWESRIGLRTLTIERKKDRWGESFAHVVNGMPIFAMGANYIPEDNLLGRVSKERTRKLLEDCKKANFNTVRVWGGGYYPENWFFDLCDELGFMVWQDFMFACGVYELTLDFEENIRAEFIDNINRIRHHACLALWCGNNEMELFVKDGNWISKPSEVRDYLLMYERIIPKILEEYAPYNNYWPASPSSGGSFDAPNDPNRGDVHYWDVWHGNKPFSEYRKFYFRYLSEFGFQSFPSKNTISTFTDKEEDLNIFSYIMEKHQRNGSANGKIMNYMQQTYKYPSSFDMVLYASQMLQADAIRYGVEHLRRNRGRCMGAIYWQLNDCWPVVSWSSIDYTGRWKALHYFAKRFFQPIMISCEEEGWLTQEIPMNWEHFQIKKSIRLNVTNETLQVEDITVIFTLPKYFQYENPKLKCIVQENELLISSSAYARGVEIQNENEDLLLSDNYFDMNGGGKKIQIIRGATENIRVRSVYDIK